MIQIAVSCHHQTPKSVLQLLVISLKSLQMLRMRWLNFAQHFGGYPSTHRHSGGPTKSMKCPRMANSRLSNSTSTSFLGTLFILAQIYQEPCTSLSHLMHSLRKTHHSSERASFPFSPFRSSPGKQPPLVASRNYVSLLVPDLHWTPEDIQFNLLWTLWTMFQNQIIAFFCLLTAPYCSLMYRKRGCFVFYQSGRKCKIQRSSSRVKTELQQCYKVSDIIVNLIAFL